MKFLKCSVLLTHADSDYLGEGIFSMVDRLPQEWLELPPDEKRKVLSLLRLVGIEGVRELLGGQLPTLPSKAP